MFVAASFCTIVTLLCLQFLVKSDEKMGHKSFPKNIIKTNSENIGSKSVSTNTTVTNSPEWINYQRERFTLDDKIEKTTDDHNFRKILDKSTKRENESESGSENGSVIEIEAESESPKPKEGNSGKETTSMVDFIKFLKSINSNIWRINDIDHLNKKVKVLNTLSDNLMIIIEKQFSAMWHDAHEANIMRRQKRGILNESSLHYLPEVSLISICFLTFSVFLIKLVLQVVNIIKSRHYTFNGNSATTVRVG